MPSQRISQRDIAARANVHFTTVSLALRNSPTLPVETRERIRKMADEMGYRPDPMLTALQSYRKAARSTPGGGGVLAWINTFKPAKSLYAVGSHIDLYRRGAVRRCEELGYRIEEFRLSELSMARLNKVLHTRNIQGILMPPQPRNRSHLNFDWENYSAVSFGYTLSRPRLHVVTNAQYGSTRMAMRKIRSYGYRRIGFVTSHVSDERTDQNFSAAYMADDRRSKPEDCVPMLILSDNGMENENIDFLRWYERHRPEVILTHTHNVQEYMLAAGIRYNECGLALLARRPDDREFAGVDQNDMLIGQSAVDLLVAMMNRNERGIPETALRVLVEGRWVDGPSVRHLNVSA